MNSFIDIQQIIKGRGHLYGFKSPLILLWIQATFTDRLG